jgi:hypothetical protein
MYVVDSSTPDICNNLEPSKYCGKFEINGKSKQFYYDRPDQVPTYLIVDTKTGNERFYSDLKDAPPADRAILERLQRR